MSAAATFAYVSCSDSGKIEIFQLDPATGDLEARGSVHAGDQVMPMAVSPDRRCLYAGLRGKEPEIVSYRIDPASGGLREIGRTPLPDSVPYLSCDRLGRFMLSTSFMSGTVQVHPIGRHGQVQPRPVMVEHHMRSAHCIMTDPSNQFVVAPVRDANMVIQRRFNEHTGVLTPNDPPIFRLAHDAGPRHFIFHPNNRFAYIINEANGTIDVCDYDIATGKLSAIHTVNMMPEGFTGHSMAADLQTTPDGRFLYASERALSNICVYAIDSDHGGITEVQRHPAEELPRSFRVDAGGRYLLAPGHKSASLTVHAIDQETGKLSDLSRHKLSAGSAWVELVDLP